MARIETFQERFIPDISTKPSNLGVIKGVSDIGVASAEIGLRFKQARDTTMVNQQYAKFQQEILTDYEDLKTKTKNPDKFREEWDKFYTEKKDTYLSNPDLSRAAKRSLDTILTREQPSQSAKAQQTQRELELVQYASNVENAAVDNNMMAYRGGENLDLDTLKQSEKIIKGNIIAGSTLVSRDKLEESARKQTTNVYKNFIKGAAGSDIEYAKALVENKEVQDKLGSVEVIDEMRGYISRVEKEAKTRTKNLKQAALNVETQTVLQGQFDEFNIELEEGRDVIKNKDLNNPDDLIFFRDNVRDAYSNGQITDEQYRNWMAKTTSAFSNLIRRETKRRRTITERAPVEEVGALGFLFYNTVNQQLVKDIQSEFEGNPEIGDSEFVGIYEDTIKELKQEGINLNTVDTESKIKAQEIFKKNTENYVQLRTARSDAQSAVVGNRIMPLNSEAVTPGKKLDNGGYTIQIARVGNRKFKLTIDQAGTIVSQEEIK